MQLWIDLEKLLNIFFFFAKEKTLKEKEEINQSCDIFSFGCWLCSFHHFMCISYIFIPFPFTFSLFSCSFHRYSRHCGKELSAVFSSYVAHCTFYEAFDRPKYPEFVKMWSNSSPFGLFVECRMPLLIIIICYSLSVTRYLLPLWFLIKFNWFQFDSFIHHIKLYIN